jgi:molybdenum cofactor cytidylyltransferase
LRNGRTAFQHMTEKTDFGVVILAAGASSRMGRPKMLLPWGDTTVIGRLLEQWRGIQTAQIAVVCAAGDLRIAVELDRIGVPLDSRIINPDPARGMFSSIQCAARWRLWNAALTHVAFALGDQPHLASATLRSVAAFAGAQPEHICQPGYQGRPRHPVFVPLSLFESLASSTAATLKDFLAAHAFVARQIESDDSGLTLDLDTPADYEQARRHLGSEGQGTTSD